MKKYIALLYIAVAFGAIYMYQHRPTYVEPLAPEGTNARLWKRGRVMYAARCISCHNPNPDLAGSVGPKLRGVSEELLRERLTNGKGGMPAQKEMVRFAKAFREFLR